VSEVNDAVNVIDFFTSHILPELQDGDHSRRPMVKACALKFVSTFRNQFAREHLVALLPLLISHLGSPSVVVHTFAAFGIERVLVTRDPEFGGQRMKVGRQDIQPLLQPLFSGLFSIIDREDLNENDVVIKCVMRCLSISNEDLVPVTDIVLNKLTGTITRIAANPRNPEYNHYVFESIAVLIRALCSRDPSVTESFERLLFPPFQAVLQKEVLELSPYVFQVLAQLLEYRPRQSGLGEAYTTLFPPLLMVSLWDRNGNVPALTRLLHAYLSKDATTLVAAGNLTGILGIFQKLLSVGRFNEYAFEILNAVITHVSPEALGPYIGTIFQLVIHRLAAMSPEQRQKSQKFVKPLTQFFAIYAGKYGSASFMEKLDAVSQGKSLQIVKEVWVPALLQDPPRRMEAKIQVIGLTRLLCETPVLLTNDSGREVWAHTLATLVIILTNPSFSTGSTDPTDASMDVQIGYDAQYSKLSFARQQPDDPFQDIDPQSAFLQGLHHLSASHPGVLGPLVHVALQSDLKLTAGLEAMLKNAGLTLA
jgi:exportin-2 (importin alpha re-exporter)